MENIEYRIELEKTIENAFTEQGFKLISKKYNPIGEGRIINSDDFIRFTFKNNEGINIFVFIHNDNESAFIKFIASELDNISKAHTLATSGYARRTKEGKGVFAIEKDIRVVDDLDLAMFLMDDMDDEEEDFTPEQMIDLFYFACSIFLDEVFTNLDDSIF